MHFKRIALAIAFSPRVEALLAEAARLKKLWNSDLILIHVGEQNDSSEMMMFKLVETVGLKPDDVTVCWRKGRPSIEILKACEEEKIDLLVSGALQKEGIVNHYVGSIARQILRKANCSVLTLVHPSITPQPFNNIVVNAEESPQINFILNAACNWATIESAKWLHIAREIPLYSLSVASAEHVTEDEYSHLKRSLVETEVDSIQSLLGKIPHKNVKINIKVLSGKSGFEVAQFARRKLADLLIVGAPPRRLSLLDRIFPHDLEYVLADLPCNLLVLRPTEGKEGDHA